MNPRIATASVIALRESWMTMTNHAPYHTPVQDDQSYIKRHVGRLCERPVSERALVIGYQGHKLDRRDDEQHASGEVRALTLPGPRDEGAERHHDRAKLCGEVGA